MRRSSRSVRVRLEDMETAIATARLAVEWLDQTAFEADVFRRATVERMVEIVSEASRHIPVEMKSVETGIPWVEIAAIGNILRHGYDVVDPLILWKLVREDFDPLDEAVRRLIQAVEGE